MNSQVMVNREMLTLWSHLMQSSGWIGISKDINTLLATPTPIPDAGEGVEFQSAADEAFRKWEKDGNPIAGVNGYMAARAGFREGAAWHNRIVSALQASAMVVPDGYKLVPIEPTPKMLAATTESKHPLLRAEIMKDAAIDYKKMLEASPSAKGGE